MKDQELIQMASDHRVFAVVRAPSAQSALRAAEAAIIGGIKLIEVALSTPGSFRVISDLRHRYGDRAAIGAGSVMSHDQIDRAIKSSAQFISMSHTNEKLVAACRNRNIPSIIGALTPTEVAAAWAREFLPRRSRRQRGAPRSQARPPSVNATRVARP